ncbi:hypothetical protein P154DRAFT_495822 [Amniculicola lignicola CBS 123094]|uniref:Rhodopsin domain-containing protein n=1 Tax=Amniculicola lignicola CBS 123094 TaxID=1392246 RepID=A0A6A5W8W7_9PLEO|nr:hypothetical protein P154DRAFT_495822 [Amniculicola lignicola CBS 123094]
MNGTRPNFNRFRPNAGDTTTAPILLGVGGGLMAISIGLLVARLWSRLRPYTRLNWDDWTVLAATILALGNYILLSLSVVHGLGRHARFVSFARRRQSMHLLFVSQVVWYYAITLVKLSVAILLLRVKRSSLRWRLFIHTIIGLLIITVIVQTCFQFLQCTPFRVYWDPRVFRLMRQNGGTVVCFPRSVINGNVISFSTIHVAVDLIFSFIPITFIKPLRLPRREKIFMCLLMALGLFASAGAIMRTLQIQGFYTSRDLFRKNVNISLWAVVEMQFALIAATIPTLKSFAERILVRVGLFFYRVEEEKVVRGRLVAFGLLDKDEEMILEVRSPRKEKFEVEVKPARERKLRDEFGEVLFSVDQEGDKEVEDMLERRGEKGKG